MDVGVWIRDQDTRREGAVPLGCWLGKRSLENCVALNGTDDWLLFYFILLGSGKPSITVPLCNWTDSLSTPRDTAGKVFLGWRLVCRSPDALR